MNDGNGAIVVTYALAQSTDPSGSVAPTTTPSNRPISPSPTSPTAPTATTIAPTATTTAPTAAVPTVSAADDTFDALAGQSLYVPAAGVLDNDSPIDSPKLRAALVTPPANGTVSLNPDGSFVYSPTYGTTAFSDSFTYTTTDGTDTSAPATVTINVHADKDSGSGGYVSSTPTIAVASQDGCRDGNTGMFTVTVGDPEAAVSDLHVSASSSDPTVAGVFVSGNGAQRTISIRALQAGQATVTINVSNGTRSSSTAINVVRGTAQTTSLSGGTGPDLLISRSQNTAITGLTSLDVSCVPQ